ncbi:1-acylglycerol-3-phosphate O-acyltransferase [Dongshaea marina]|uniref:1-acylglycerol-3-phosphate O-acyltransferase n=1 Tax=Dongshaea marina TaxID=2047966 RepID=UPI000D3E2334|nr:1-acylglycerol-3-phosphate O-acyltransferase [Dongshaea marina]
MLKLIRIVLLALFIVISAVFGCIYCLFRPRNHKNVHTMARFFFWATRFLGVKVRLKVADEIKELGSAVYIANHQSNFDIFVLTGAVQPGVVSVGKRSLAWLPFFGQLYWLSGNILINREKQRKAADTIRQVVESIREKKGMSVWMFPEGTRSRGRGLLPFKNGPFHTAVQAEVPVVPVVCSDYVGQIDLNRWNNGEILIEIMPPILKDAPQRESARKLNIHCRRLMEGKLEELNSQVQRPEPLPSQKMPAS